MQQTRVFDPRMCLYICSVKCMTVAKFGGLQGFAGCLIKIFLLAHAHSTFSVQLVYTETRYGHALTGNCLVKQPAKPCST